MSKGEKKDAIKEAKFMMALKHPNIVGFREVFATKSGSLNIIMEYCDDGDLEKKIITRREEVKNKGRSYYPEDQVIQWFTMIALGIKHCHDRHILHRDLKAANIFCTRTGMVKLGDFGVSKCLERTHDMVNSGAMGTPYYMAPELFDENPYSFPADIWSLGVLLY